jgi:hypothetical protein
MRGCGTGHRVQVPARGRVFPARQSRYLDAADRDRVRNGLPGIRGLACRRSGLGACQSCTRAAPAVARVGRGESERRQREALAMGGHASGGAPRGAGPSRRPARAVGRERPHAGVGPGPRGGQRAARDAGQRDRDRASRHPLRVPSPPRARHAHRRRNTGRSDAKLCRGAPLRRRSPRVEAAGRRSRDHAVARHLLSVRRGRSGHAASLCGGGAGTPSYPSPPASFGDACVASTAAPSAGRGSASAPAPLSREVEEGRG